MILFTGGSGGMGLLPAGGSLEGKDSHVSLSAAWVSNSLSGGSSSVPPGGSSWSRIGTSGLKSAVMRDLFAGGIPGGPLEDDEALVKAKAPFRLL